MVRPSVVTIMGRGTEGLEKTTLLLENLLMQLMYLPPQIVQLGQFRIDIQLVIVVAVGFRLGD